MAGKADSLIEQLASEVKPVRRLASPTVRFLRWLGASALYVAVCLRVLGPRPDLSEAAGSPAFLAATLLLALAAVASAWLAFCFSVPGRSGERGVRLASRLVAGIGAVSFLGLIVLLATSLGPPDHGWKCSLHLALVALVPAVLLGLMLRRAAPLQWVRTGLVLGVASAGLGALALQFACCSGDAMHLLVWHALPGFLFVALAVVVAGWRWRRL